MIHPGTAQALKPDRGIAKAQTETAQRYIQWGRPLLWAQAGRYNGTPIMNTGDPAVPPHLQPSVDAGGPPPIAETTALAPRRLPSLLCLVAVLILLTGCGGAPSESELTGRWRCTREAGNGHRFTIEFYPDGTYTANGDELDIGNASANSLLNAEEEATYHALADIISDRGGWSLDGHDLRLGEDYPAGDRQQSNTTDEASGPGSGAETGGSKSLPLKMVVVSHSADHLTLRFGDDLILRFNRIEPEAPTSPAE